MGLNVEDLIRHLQDLADDGFGELPIVDVYMSVITSENIRIIRGYGHSFDEEQDVLSIG